MGSRPIPKGSFTAAALEAVLDIDNESFSGIFDDIPPPAPTSNSTAETTDCSAVPNEAPAETPRSYGSLIPKEVSFRGPSSLPSQSHAGSNNFPSENPQDFLLDDFMDVPSDFMESASVVMAPAHPVGPPTETPACFPSESPSHRCRIVDVGPPTDLVCLPPMGDPEGAGIGVVSPETRPRMVMQTSKKQAPPYRRKTRPAYARRTSCPNTLEAQYWRQASSSRSFPRVPTLAYTGRRVSPQPYPARSSAGWYGRRPQRRSHGLSPMPYAHPMIPSSPRTYSSASAPYTVSTMRPRPQPRSWQS